jgi:hypothetical protein
MGLVPLSAIPCYWQGARCRARWVGRQAGRQCHAMPSVVDTGGLHYEEEAASTQSAWKTPGRRASPGAPQWPRSHSGTILRSSHYHQCPDGHSHPVPSSPISEGGRPLCFPQPTGTRPPPVANEMKTSPTRPSTGKTRVCHVSSPTSHDAPPTSRDPGTHCRHRLHLCKAPSDANHAKGIHPGRLGVGGVRRWIRSPGRTAASSRALGTTRELGRDPAESAAGTHGNPCGKVFGVCNPPRSLCYQSASRVQGPHPRASNASIHPPNRRSNRQLRVANVVRSTTCRGTLWGPGRKSACDMGRLNGGPKWGSSARTRWRIWKSRWDVAAEKKRSGR